MVNHFRNLLLSRRKPDDQPEAPWERYMPEDFQPIALPSWLEEIRSTLVGPGDWWDITLRAECLLSVLFSHRFDQYNKLPDPRITPVKQDPFYAAWGNQITSLNEAARQAMGVGLVLLSPAGNEYVRRVWHLTVIEGPQMQVLYRTKTFVSTLPAVQLSSDIIFSVQTAGLILGASWDVTSLTKPQSTLTQVYQDMRTLPFNSLSKLFTVEFPDESIELPTFKRWYEKDRFEEDQLAGLLFAFLRKAQHFYS
jgi:hypothetical protein